MSENAILSVRKKVCFDKEWRFCKGEVKGSQENGYDDNNWITVDLPHDFSIEGPFDKDNPSGESGGFLPRGIGWYRKTFDLSEVDKDKRVVIEFDGVYQNSEVWINETYIGKRPYGYVSFQYEITPYIRFDRDNIIAVRVDNTKEPNSRWYPGSGIYRHVWLTTTEKLHIGQWGTYVTTPVVSKESVEISIRTTVVNESDYTLDCSLETTILDKKGKEVAKVEGTGTITKGGHYEFSQQLVALQPELWSLDNTVLYKACSKLLCNGNVVDSYITPFGVREFSFDKDKGFFLNGQNLKLKGVSIHHDAGCLGAAVPEAVLERRLEVLKELGCNAIRTSHNPPASELLDMCDRMGFLVIDEAFDKWHSGYYSEFFEKWWEKDLESMLLRDRNHPSIIVWSVGNEVENQGSESMLGTLKMLVDHVHKVDPTRPVTYALAPQQGDNPQDKIEKVMKIAAITDILGCNYQEPFYKYYRKANPEIIIIGTEIFAYFRGTLDNHKAHDPKNPWFDVTENDYVVGGFLWSGIDYLGEAQPWPSKGWSTGVIDTCGFRKPRSYFFESVWSNKPMVHISVFNDSAYTNAEKLQFGWPKLESHWTYPHFKGELVRLVTFTNCEEVELFINNISMGKKYLSDYPDHMIIWYAPYEEGSIKAVGRTKGNEVSEHVLHTAGYPASIKLKVDRTQIPSGTQEIVHIEVHVIDEKGIIVPEADNEITFELKGAGRIIGVDNGDLCSNESYKSNKRKVYKGKGLVIVQSTGLEDALELTAVAAGLGEGKIVINCVR